MAANVLRMGYLIKLANSNEKEHLPRRVNTRTLPFENNMPVLSEKVIIYVGQGIHKSLGGRCGGEAKGGGFCSANDANGAQSIC